MVMRWKVLEVAQQCSSLDELLHELEKHPEYDLPKDRGLQLLLEYIDILPEKLRDELHARETRR